MRSYEAARTYFSILGFISWCVIIVGGIVLLMGMGAGSQVNSFGGRSAGMGILGALPGVAVMFFGFLGLVFVQIGRAGVDTAEYTQQMLKIARDQLEVSQRSLRQGNDLAQSFAVLANREAGAAPEPSTASFADVSKETAPSAATVPEQPAVAHQPGDTLQYRGRTIKVVEAGFIFGGTVYPTLERAQAKIDEDGTFLPPPAKSPPPYADQLGGQRASKLGGVSRRGGST